jgi:hypothetical protein
MVTALAFIVLGGSAVAALELPKNSVGTKQIRDGAVTGRDVHKGTLTGANVRDGSLTGADLAAASIPAGDVTGLPTAPSVTPPGGTIPAGTTLRGTVAPVSNTNSPGTNMSAAQGVSFGGYELPERPLVHVVPPGGPATEPCPGSVTDPQASSGYLCIYVTEVTPTGGQLFVIDPTTASLVGLTYNFAKSEATSDGDGRISPFGFVLQYDPTGTTSLAEVRAVWAVTG